MQLDEKKIGYVTTIKPLMRTIDASISTEFKSKFMDLINHGNKQILINLSEVDFVDSSALGALIAILKQLKQHHGHLAICDIKLPILNMLKLTRLDQVFSLFSNEKEALIYLNEHNAD